MQRFPRGEQEWEGFLQLAEPLQLMGVDRRAFFLSAIFSYVLYMSMGFMVSAVIFVLILGVFRALSRMDPHIITVLGAAASQPHGWYDYDSAPSPQGMGAVIRPPLDCWPHRGDEASSW